MKKVLLGLFVMTTSITLADHPVRHVNKVVIWAYKLHSHTHSYIHYGYDKTYRYLGFDTYWFDDRDNVSSFDFSNCLFVTMGATDNHRMPIRNDCYYIVHNGDKSKYQNLLNNGHAILLQVYTHDCLKRKEPALDFCIHHDLEHQTIYMPWATDLLPYEIDAIKKELPSIQKTNEVSFIGSIYFTNQRQWYDFEKACKQDNLAVNVKNRCFVSMEQNIHDIRKAYLAPAIQSQWQCENGYIPCRIFKNISYGAMGITNNPTVYELFNKKIVFNPDSYQLFFDAQKALKTFSLEKQCELIDFVRDRHTYLNRIESMFMFFELRQAYLNHDEAYYAQVLDSLKQYLHTGVINTNLLH